MKKIVNIEKAGGKVVRTLVDSNDFPEYFVEEAKAKPIDLPIKEKIKKAVKAVKKVIKKSVKK